MKLLCIPLFQATLGLALLVLSAPSVLGQLAPSVNQGFDPTTTYGGTNIDSEDMVTGRLNIHIPLLTDKSQRGNLNFSYSINWSGYGPWVQDCSGYDLFGYCQWHPDYVDEEFPDGPEPMLNGGLSIQGAAGDFEDDTPCTQIQESGGGVHPFQSQIGTYSTCADNPPPYLEAVDGSGLQVQSTATTLISINRSGVQFQYGPATQIEDTHGNLITAATPQDANPIDFGPTLFSGDPLNPYWLSSPGLAWTLTDTLNRQWQLTNSTDDLGNCSSGTSNAQFWTTPGLNGSMRTFTFCYTPVVFNTDLASPNGITTEQIQGAQIPALTEAILPDGTRYTLHYDDDYGDLTELDLPTGGNITYTYTTIDEPCDNSGYYLRTLTSRTVSDGVTSQTWHYYLTSGQTTVADPLGEETVYSHPTGTFTCQPVNSVAYYDTSNNLLKTVTTQFNNYTDWFSWDGEINLPVSVTTTLGASGPSSIVSQIYDPGFTYYFGKENQFTSPYGLVISQSQYDYDNTLISQTGTSYIALQNSAYLAQNILDAPLIVTVTSQGGDVCSQTEYDYDNPQLTVASGVDSAGQHLTPPNPYATGNVNSIVREVFNNPCQSTTPSMTPSATTRYVYDTGMVQKEEDQNLKSTTYSYSSTYLGAYPTNVSNDLNQATNYTYDINTGLMVSSEDANLQTTTYTYDNMLRPHETDYPDGGMEIWTPNYSSNVYTGSTYTKKINSSTTYSATTINDGVGRTTQIQVADPQGMIYTDTAYDGLGRVASVSNPYRSKTEGTYGATSYLYDALNRMTLKCDQDNGNNVPCAPGSSYTTLQYNGNLTDIYDQDGLHTQQTTDGAGRVTKILEQDDLGNLDLETDYGYDSLNNLISVNQKGLSTDTPRTRSFGYDSLSRLLTAGNPESGTTTYSYNLSGGGLCAGDTSSVCRRTDARGVVTTYSYDGLNRLYAKAYNDGSPSVSITYDVPSAYAYTPNNANNFVGHMSSISTALGTTPVTNKYISGYDPMGRETGYIECGYAGDCSSTDSESAFSADYTYDLAGNVMTLNTGIGQLGELYPENSDQTQYRYFSYDAVNRLATAEANTDLSPGSQQYQVTSYGPIGMTAAIFPDYANNPLVTVGRSYDSRQRLTGETDSSPTAGTLYSYGLVFQANNSVRTMQDSVIGSATAGYGDWKNRLTSLAYSAGPYSGLSMSWTYDAFGNRLTQTPSGTYSGYAPAAQTNTYATNNQISTSTSAPTGIAYDGSGNVSNDGTNQYFYDGEGRLCGVYNNTGTGATTAYIYDGEGSRVARGAVAGPGCYSTSNGFTLSNAFIVGQNGEQLDETDNYGFELHSNTFAGGQLLFTYDNNFSEWGLALNDWLGTKRVQVDPEVVGNLTQFLSLPYGDGLTPSGYGMDSTEQHFTGKERDAESGNDYFGARYYGSTLGRFLSPDEPFVDQSSTDPQSWNLYGYVRNNPLTNIDPDGQDCLFVGEQSGTGVAQVTTIAGNCPSDIGSGIYVPGTVDQSSLSFNGQQLSFGYTPYGGGDYTFGSGVPGYSLSSDSFASGSMAAALFGAGGRPYFNAAAGTVNAVGNAELNAAGLVFPWEHLAVTLLSGSTPSGVQQAAGGLRRKPGSLGQFGDNSRELKFAKDIAKRLGLNNPGDAALIHKALQEGNADAGRPLSFREALDYVSKFLGLAE